MNLKKQIPLVILLIVVVAVAIFVVQKDRKDIMPIQGYGLDIETWQINGTRVMYVYAPELPMVDVRVVFDAGSARDGNKPGLSTLTNLMLNRGAGEWNTNQLVERFDGVGAELSKQSLRDMAVVSLRSLTEKEWLKVALDTMAAILQEPVFDANELEREKNSIYVALKNQQEDPGDVASLAFYKALYGDHPYASPDLGTRESVASITREDLQAFYKKYYVANNAIIAIVGAVDKKQARQIAMQLVGPLESGEKAPLIDEVPSLNEAVTIRKQHPSSQTTILLGHPGNYRGDPDYFALYVGNHVLGGSGFGSRIMKEVREKRGLAYSSYSYFSPMRRKGPFLMGLQTRNDQAEEALKIVRDTLSTFIEQGPTEDELQHSKMNITGGFPLKLDSNKDILAYIAMIGFYDLPLDYLKNFNTNVERVTIEQIRDAFQRRIDPNKMVTVMVGGLGDKTPAK
jgi:zinc protease